jgi:hypothetical protein
MAQGNRMRNIYSGLERTTIVNSQSSIVFHSVLGSHFDWERRFEFDLEGVTSRK